MQIRAALLGCIICTSTSLSASGGSILYGLYRSDARVATTGWKLATANRALCDAGERVTGLRLHALPLYAPAFQQEARQLFELDVRPALLVVVPGSAADRAGLKENDTLSAVNGVTLKATPSGKVGADQLAALELQLAKVQTSVPLTVERAGKAITINFTPEAGCSTRFELNPSSKRNAGADGAAVRITTAVVNETRDDAELAFVLAHELAHNIAGHPVLLEQVGRKAARVRATEIEADKMAIAMMHKAGFDPTAAGSFWARFGKKTGYGIFSDGTHMRTKARVALLYDEAVKVTTAPRQSAAQ